MCSVLIMVGSGPPVLRIYIISYKSMLPLTDALFNAETPSDIAFRLETLTIYSQVGYSSSYFIPQWPCT